MCSTSDIAKNSRVASTATSFSKALQVKATVERNRGPLHTYNEIPGDERVVPLVVLLALATRSEDDRNVVGAQVQPAGDVGEEGANNVLVDVDGVVTFDQEPLPDDFGCQVRMLHLLGGRPRRGGRSPPILIMPCARGASVPPDADPGPGRSFCLASFWTRVSTDPTARATSSRSLTRGRRVAVSPRGNRR